MSFVQTRSPLLRLTGAAMMAAATVGIIRMGGEIGESLHNVTVFEKQADDSTAARIGHVIGYEWDALRTAVEGTNGVDARTRRVAAETDNMNLQVVLLAAGLGFGGAGVEMFGIDIVPDAVRRRTGLVVEER